MTVSPRFDAGLTGLGSGGWERAQLTNQLVRRGCHKIVDDENDHGPDDREDPAMPGIGCERERLSGTTVDRPVEQAAQERPTTPSKMVRQRPSGCWPGASKRAINPMTSPHNAQPKTTTTVSITYLLRIWVLLQPNTAGSVSSRKSLQVPVR